jgi:ribosomal protein L29
MERYQERGRQIANLEAQVRELKRKALESRTQSPHSTSDNFQIIS